VEECRGHAGAFHASKGVMMASKCRLVVRYHPDPSGYGSIKVGVVARGFSGHSGHVATADEIQPFLKSLAEYPLRSAACLAIGTGFDEGPLIRLTVEQENARGAIFVNVELVSDHDQTRRVATSFFCTCADIEAFRLGLESALQSEGDTILSGCEIAG
jgi:hypothetical protein